MSADYSPITLEKMEEEELAFMTRKYQNQRRLFLRTMRTFSFLAFLVPTVTAILFYTHRDEERERSVRPEGYEPYTLTHYFISLAVLFVLLYAIGYASYVMTLKRLKMDVREQMKIIEKTHITRKQFMAINKQYYFYLASGDRLSIEVDEDDFHKYNEGDELNIEYARHSKEFIGYF